VPPPKATACPPFSPRTEEPVMERDWKEKNGRKPSSRLTARLTARVKTRRLAAG
jgi:hypothetical protein